MPVLSCKCNKTINTYASGKNCAKKGKNTVSPKNLYPPLGAGGGGDPRELCVLRSITEFFSVLSRMIVAPLLNYFPSRFFQDESKIRYRNVR